MSVLARRSLVFRLVFLAVVYTGASANTPGMSIASARCVGSSPTARIAREIGVATQMGNERYSGYQKSDIRSQISEVRCQESVLSSVFCPLSSVFFYPQLVRVDPGRLHRAPLSGKSIQWDSKNAQIVNESGPNQYLRRKYRRGWAL
jgi:hypothetical protein